MIRMRRINGLASGIEVIIAAQAIVYGLTIAIGVGGRYNCY
jgi:hypothetical protein